MIVKLLMELLKVVILFVISLFPVLPDTGFIADFISTFVSLVGSVNSFISIPIVGLCLVLIILCHNARAVWSILMWVIRKIPGVS